MSNGNWKENVMDDVHTVNNSSAQNNSAAQQNVQQNNVNAGMNNNMSGGPEPFIGQQTNTQNIPFGQSITLTNILSKLDTQISLSEKGMEYHKALKEGLEDTSSRNNLKCEKLTDSSYVFYDTSNRGVVVTYTEAYNNSEDDTILRLYREARTVAYERYGMQIINVIGVHKEDYDKVGVMITDIKNLFITDSPEYSRFDINDLKKTKFSIDQNIERVKNFVRAMSPHAIPAAFDMGFLVNILVNKDNNNQFVVGNGQKNNFESRPIAAVLGKVNFICNHHTNLMQFGGNQNVFLPNIVITDIISPIKMQSLLPVFISLAFQVFIGYGSWKNCFKQFGVKGAVNIGNLMEDQTTHMLVNITNDTDVEIFCNTFCKTPILTIAINEGRVRIPGIEYFGDNSSLPIAATNISNFLGVQIPHDRIIATRTPEYVGTTTIGGQLCDTRYIDYLRIVAENPNEASNVRNLMLNYINPMDKYKFICNLAPDTSAIKYLAFGCTLKSELVGCISNEMSKVNISMDNSINNQFFDNNALIAESNNYMNLNVNTFNAFSNAGNYNYGNFYGYKF